MKFFTYELWAAMQGPRSGAAEQEWMKRSAAYLAGLSKLKNRIGPAQYRFLTTQGFHDSRLLSVETGRNGALSFVLERAGEVALLQLQRVTKWTVCYEATKGSVLSDPPFEWGYEEISSAGRNGLQLDILFSSGASFIVRFSEMRIRRRARAA